MNVAGLPPKRRALACGVALVACGLALAAMWWPGSARSLRPPAVAPSTPPDELVRRSALEGVLQRLEQLPADRLQPEAHPLWALPEVEAAAPTVAVAAPEAEHHLNLVVARPTGGYAVVDGEVVRKGSRLADGSLVRSIEPGRVTLQRPGGRLQQLRVNNRFTESVEKEVSP